jgi:hypothetical protein
VEVAANSAGLTSVEKISRSSRSCSWGRTIGLRGGADVGRAVEVLPLKTDSAGLERESFLAFDTMGTCLVRRPATSPARNMLNRL